MQKKKNLAYVDGSIQQPTADEPTASIWSHCNSMVISWLLNAASKDIDDNLLYLDTAQAVWSNLHDPFSQSNATRIFQIKQQLHRLSQGSLDLNTYYTRLNIFWDELKNYQPVLICNCGGMKAYMDYQQQEYVMQFLIGLNESYGGI